MGNALRREKAVYRASCAFSLTCNEGTSFVLKLYSNDTFVLMWERVNPHLYKFSSTFHGTFEQSAPSAADGSHALKLTCESVNFLCKGDAVADEAARQPRTDYRGVVLPDESLHSIFDPAIIRPFTPIVAAADVAAVGDAFAPVVSVVAAEASAPVPAPAASVPASIPAGLFASEAWFPHAEDQRAAQFGTATLPFTFRVPPQLLCFEVHVSADQKAARVEVNTIDVRQTHGLVFKREVEKLDNKKQ